MSDGSQLAGELEALLAGRRGRRPRSRRLRSVRCRRSRESASSSTTRIGSHASGDRLRTSARSDSRHGLRRLEGIAPWPGSSMVKVDPLPSSLETLMSPPIIRQNRRLIGEAEAGAAVVAGGRIVGLGELLEDLRRACPRAMPMPVSETSDRDPVGARRRCLARRRERDGAFVGELGGVGEQVEERLSELGQIGADRLRGRRRSSVTSRLCVLGHQRRDGGQRLVEHLPQVEASRGRGPSARPRSWRGRGCR